MANEFRVKKGLIITSKEQDSLVVNVEGTQGQLFSVTDSLTGSLHSVNDISGIPILEVFSNDTVKMGTYNSEAVIVAGSDFYLPNAPAVDSQVILVRAPDGKIGTKEGDFGEGTSSGTSGTSGTRGTSGSSGTSGTTGTSGTSGTSGTRGTSGSSGSSGSSGTSGTRGTSGSSGSSGTSGTSGLAGDRFASTSNTSMTISTGAKSFTIGTGLQWIGGQQMLVAFNSSNYMTVTVDSYNIGTGAVTATSTAVVGSGTYSTWNVNTVGAPGQSGSSGTSGTSGVNGATGSTGPSGPSGSSGSSGTSGTSGTRGTSGTSGVNGANGASGSSGTSGVNGANGASGSSGTSGTRGTSGTSGVNGINGINQNPNWGQIGGTLSNQTDLQSALNAKINKGSASNNIDYVFGENRFIRTSLSDGRYGIYGTGISLEYGTNRGAQLFIGRIAASTMTAYIHSTWDGSNFGPYELLHTGNSHTHSATEITSGTLVVGRGGTGATTHTSGNVLIGGGTGAITSLSRSGIDTRTSFPPSAHVHSAEDITTGTLVVTRGGTGATTHTSGNVLIGNGTNAITSLSRSGIDTRTSFPPDTSVTTPLYVLKAGDTMTGALNITFGTAGAKLSINRNDNTINSQIKISTTTADVFIGQGDNGWFAIGNISDIRFGNNGKFRVQASSGNVETKGDVVAFATSDSRLKNNLKIIENPLEKINKMNGYSFEWNTNQDLHYGNDYGIVAQEVEKILPEIVTTRDNGYKAVKYEKLIPLLIEAIKQLDREVKELKSKLN
jgi:hypothetical protein